MIILGVLVRMVVIDSCCFCLLESVKGLVSVSGDNLSCFSSLLMMVFVFVLF